MEDRGVDIYKGFPQWLVSRLGWEVSGDPIWAVQGQTASDAQAWTEFWRLLWECVDSQPAAAATEGSQADSKRDTEDQPRFDDELSPEESARLAGLPARDLDEIDAAVLAIAHHRWQKVAFIVGQMLSKHREASDGHLVPMGFYVRRIAVLAAEGSLESKGTSGGWDTVKCGSRDARRTALGRSPSTPGTGRWPRDQKAGSPPSWGPWGVGPGTDTQTEG